MSNAPPTALHNRVVSAAEAVLARNGAVGPLELLQEVEFLHSSHVHQWQKGSEYYPDLESRIQCGEKKLNDSYRYFLEWVHQQGLEPIEAAYACASRFSSEPLRITVDGDPEREQFFRTQFRSANLTPAKQQRLEKKLNKVPDLLVYQLTSPQSQCSECGAEMFKGELLFLEKGEPLCLTCADLDQLEFLPSGDTALTRRSRKYSSLAAIVVKFNRSRKRYERQGILAAPEAIARAEDECASDADERAARRQQDAARRGEQDKQLVADMTQVIREQYPGCPPAEARAIAAHTAERGSGRVGRSAAGRAISPQAVSLAVVAWVRHQHTEYDTLLMRGIERFDAREQIAKSARNVLAIWENSAPAE